MRYGTFHNRFTLWNIRMLSTLFSENCHLLFSRLPVILTRSLLCRGLLRYYRCCRIISFWCFPDIAYFYVLSAFVSFRYVYITYLFKLLISLVLASFYRLRLFALFSWSDPLLCLPFCYRSFKRLLTCFILLWCICITLYLKSLYGLYFAFEWYSNYFYLLKQKNSSNPIYKGSLLFIICIFCRFRLSIEFGNVLIWCIC